MTVVAASVCGGRLKLMAQTGTSDEDELVALAQTADDAGFEQLIVRHGPRLRSLLDRITREPEAAQDAFLEAVLRAWQNIDRFHARSRLQPDPTGSPVFRRCRPGLAIRSPSRLRAFGPRRPAMWRSKSANQQWST